MTPNTPNRSIFCHDNLEVLQGINSSCVDLIYLDPPFNKNKTFAAPIGSHAEGAEFDDIFRKEDVKDEWLKTIEEDEPKLLAFLEGVQNIGGRNSHDFCYLAYMAIRLLECHRILKNTGSIYLHCDPTMSHYLRLLMDCIFEEKNFRNEISWRRYHSHSLAKKTFGNITDNILFYSRTKDIVFQNKGLPDENHIKRNFNKIDEKGNKYGLIPLFNSPSMSSRPNLCYEWKGFRNLHPSGWHLSKESLEKEYREGKIVIKGDGKIERRAFLKDYKGLPLSNFWDDIKPAKGKEYNGYPTQKPLKLLERIIKASSKEGDLILDPFCGCATTCVAAEKLNRKWIGIDVSITAYNLVKRRLTKEVEGKENGQAGMLFWEEKIKYQQKLPKRTDQGIDYREKKFIYVISHPRYPGEYKVGVAKDAIARLNQYQTSDPNREYKIEDAHPSPRFREVEDHIHEVFPNKHEWVQGKLEDIISEIRRADKDGG
ncbi:MAG: DNA methyltransferase [Cytophagales bacterium]|nr:DNA methyltransferase [Cytophagales bacterium]